MFEAPPWVLKIWEVLQPYAIPMGIIGLVAFWLLARKKPERPYYLNDFHGDPGWQQQRGAKSTRRSR
ncbi:MAG TPA: hypothetical protein EYN60_06060 [Nitrospirales bacterium]|nr:hypothetical protein [Nitrospirales bacterium]